MIIKAIFMARHETESWNKADYCLIFIIVLALTSGIVGGSIWWSIYLFTDVSHQVNMFWSILGSTITLVTMVLRWCWYVNTARKTKIVNGEFIFPEKTKVVKKTRAEEALDFIKEIRHDKQ